MCGIAGYWGTGDIRAMAAVIGHRGPDEEGFHESGPVALASKRLSVIDVEGGRQPISNAAGTKWIVYNGEVFNFQELRKELSAKYAFRTATDTEVVLHAYEEWGEDCLSRLNGQFAFAIWDGAKLFLARDRLGEKPLYYAVRDGTFLFASEIKSLLAHVPARPRIPADFAVFETCLGADTMFEGILSLPPAHCMTYDGERARVRRWWDLEFAEPEGRSEDDYVEELRWLLEDSVRLRLISDVPLGLFLSGGLDSAVIAALAKPEVVFSCRFPLGEAYDEFHWAERIARHIGARQHVVTPTAEDFRGRIENIIWHLDQPIATASSIAEFMLAERAAEHVKVVLGGQGSDEIFGGYVRYLLMSAERDLGEAEELRSYKPLARHFWSADMFGDPLLRYFHLIRRGGPPGAEGAEAIRPWFERPRSLVDRMGYTDLNLSLPSLLTMNDRAAAASSLENRCPFLDHRIVEFAFRLPERLKIDGLTTKSILRKAARGWLPDDVIRRRDKKGLVVPIQQWLAKDLRAWCDERIAPVAGRFAAAAGRGEFDRSRYSALCFALWRERFFDPEHFVLDA